jgi:hypothetical protein
VGMGIMGMNFWEMSRKRRSGEIMIRMGYQLACFIFTFNVEDAGTSLHMTCSQFPLFWFAMLTISQYADFEVMLHVVRRTSVYEDRYSSNLAQVSDAGMYLYVKCESSEEGNKILDNLREVTTLLKLFI